MIQTIVFATDLCVFTPYIVQHVITLAERCQAKVVVVHAVEPLGSLGNAVVRTYLPEAASRELAEDGLKMMLGTIKERLIDFLAEDFIESRLNFNQMEDIVVCEGKPAEVILEVARNRQADLIVMGSHSPDLANGPSIGSVTHRVLQCARVPVYMVPMLPKAPADMGVAGHSSGPA